MTKSSKDMAKIAYHALEEKKGENISIIDISDISVIADYFIIASGSNKPQIQSLVDYTEECLEKAGYPTAKKEGYGSDSWILLDYGDIIIHIFDRENRLFYDLERIWRDGKSIGIEELGE